MQLCFITSFVEKCISELRRRNNLPDPHGSLSSLLTPSAIASANKEVEALLKTISGSSNCSTKRGAYNR